MQTAKTDRRAARAPRVPLDLWIRLAHEDYEEPFDADGVDLSTGGLALRADYLPEVGDRLRCHFESPASGEEIAVDGEVAWAHDAGDRSGEFGLRFDALDDHVQASLQELVRHLGGGAVAATVARLHLDGVASPIEAEILEREGRWLTVEQELPFLQMGMGVTIEGGGGAPRGSLASVDLRIVDGTPRLVLSVELDAEAEAYADEEAFADDEAFADEEAPEEPRYSESTLDEPGAAAAPDLGDHTMQDYELPEELRGSEEDAGVFARDDVQVFAVHDDDGEAMGDEDLDAPTDRWAMVKDKLLPLLGKLRVALALAWTTTRTKAGPAAKVIWAKLVALSAAIGTKAGPRFMAFFAKTKALVAKVVVRKGKRRTTAAPPKRIAGSPRRRQQQPAEEVAVAPKRNGRRILALSLLAFAGVATAVYALAGGDDAPAVEPTAQLPALDAAPVPTAPPAPAAFPTAAPFPAADPETAEAAEAIVAEAPAPEPEGGQLGAPSFPSLADADPSSAPVTEGPSFGAASVPDARSSTIRMSQSVATLRGQPSENGFTVTVPGALALDRAGPIAATNPAVERATILNRGDHAVLTVRFVAGRSPAYRVVARGRAIEVEIGR